MMFITPEKRFIIAKDVYSLYNNSMVPKCLILSEKVQNWKGSDYIKTNEEIF